jgi:hypothetical protein
VFILGEIATANRETTAIAIGRRALSVNQLRARCAVCGRWRADWPSAGRKLQELKPEIAFAIKKPLRQLSFGSSFAAGSCA